MKFLRASISSVVKVFSLAFWVDELSDKLEFVVTWGIGIETESADDKSSVKELEMFGSGIEEPEEADLKPGA